MYKNIWVVLMVFVTILFVIVVSKDLSTAVSTIALMTSFMVLATHMDNICGDAFTAAKPTAADKTKEATPESQQEQQVVYDEPQGTGVMATYPGYEKYAGYIQTYNDYPAARPVYMNNTAELSQGVDLQTVYMAQRRARDRKTLEGAVTKDAAFYGEHFGHELRDSERRVWWGENDY